ncbi:DUF4236 domain-containing protein [Novosphingopyxis sp. YJ-S2-01]|uniref:DUF4236 domain-containing protein n=1 Tax=Novosphingopyxis sp. YJ-S2-01 TaxID=2794021 RepID=UPI0018DC13E9|nr:DUF4236 domain-containing protein [Novosphingopyxis sp. YJ-S2-01]MBH9538650.1 DUF4236 domain-containing protein [Novosphingopyxis sp. YJ-S2-01]
MPFYIRKSVKAGPFRFNLSKSGIGVSTGVKGFRVGTGPRGHYIHAGRGGLYYRASIPRNGRKQNFEIKPAPKSPAPSFNEQKVEMINVSSVNVLQMEDSRFSNLLNELNEKQRSTSIKAVLGWSAAGIAFLLAITAGAPAFIFGLVLILVGIVAGTFFDDVKRTSVLMYELDHDAAEDYGKMTERFDALAACEGCWHVDSGGAVQDIHTWKRNAGASHLVDKRLTELGYSLPRVIKSNITPPFIKSGKEYLYLLPDFLLVVHDRSVGAVPYDRLKIRWEDSNFIEEGVVPSDTQIVGRTWKHPNKSGGPDRRFKDNREIPICLYESVYLSSDNGLNELLQFSKNGIMAPLAAAIGKLGVSNGSSKTQLDAPRLT